MKFKIWLVLLAFYCVSCSDFLAESSQDEVRPSTVDDMEQLLLGEIYMDKYSDELYNGTDIFTDDQQCNGLDDDGKMTTLEDQRYLFTWQKDMFDKGRQDYNVYYWAMPYERIKGCNVILDYIDQVMGDERKKEDLRAEALVMRAYYYLQLVNFFGLPYNYGDPAKNPGVPLKLDMGVTQDRYPRNSVAEVYRSIEKDLLEANRLFEKNKPERKTLRAGDLMAKSLLSRMYLYMEDWDNALKYADEVIQEKPALLDLVVAKGFEYGNVYNASTPDEIIWARPGYGLSSAWGLAPYSSSKDFVDLFDHGDWNVNEYDPWYDDGKTYYGDMRWCMCYQWEGDDGSRYMYGVNKDDEDTYHGIRTAELYLNRAEALIQKFIKSGTDEYRVKALADLNKLRLHRYDTSKKPYVDVEYSDGALLLDFCRAERRRELCGESNHRWFDLRRYGMPEIKHVFFAKPGEEDVYVLEKNSTRYVLPIPKSVLEANPRLEQNP